jgi:MOSC domain-containing protein YiiM
LKSPNLEFRVEFLQVFGIRPTSIKDFTEARRSGAYLRIIQEGEIAAGDEIKVIYRPEHEVSIRDIFDAKAGERGKIAQLKVVSELSEKYREWLSKL